MAGTTEVDYGPLAGLIGTWEGDKGLDVSPEPDGTAETAYFETLTFEPVGCALNAETQLLAVLRYHQTVGRKSDGKTIHDQTGYWMWDAAGRTVMHSLVIPRAVCVLAGGGYAASVETGAPVVLETFAGTDDPRWGILQSPFMKEKARTVAFRHRLTVRGDALEYAEATLLEIYGKRFEHTDANALTRKR
jgi:hypothetical protein